MQSKVNEIVNINKKDRPHIQEGHKCGCLYCKKNMWLYLWNEYNQTVIDLDNI